MSQMIKFKNEIFRISPKDAHIFEVARSNGAYWTQRFRATNFKFIELMDNGNEILANTDIGLQYSRDMGFVWLKRV